MTSWPETQEAMAEASAIVLAGFRLRSDVKIVRWPDRYMDDRGREFWGRVMALLPGGRRRIARTKAEKANKTRERAMRVPRHPFLLGWLLPDSRLDRPAWRPCRRPPPGFLNTDWRSGFANSNP